MQNQSKFKKTKMKAKFTLFSMVAILAVVLLASTVLAAPVAPLNLTDVSVEVDGSDKGLYLDEDSLQMPLSGCLL